MSVLSPQEETEFIIPYSDNKFKQQTVPACKPFLTPCYASIIYLVFSIISLIFGLLYYKASNDVQEFIFPYDKYCGINSTCILPINITETMDSKVYIYYELTNFYQNNFMYANSKVWKQLNGEFLPSKDDLSKCEPRTENKSTNLVLVPCGAVANSVFTDSFIFSNNFPSITKNGISIQSFKDLFKHSNNQYNPSNSERWLLKLNDTFPDEQSDERFVNWMQVSAFSKFRKLWAIVENEGLQKGNYTVTIQNNFNVNSYGGTKSIVFAEVSWIGGKNDFFGNFFIILCILSSLASLIFAILHFNHSLPLYKAIVQEQTSLALSLIK